MDLSYTTSIKIPHPIPTAKLNDGTEMPIIGLGTYGSKESGDRQKTADAVYSAIAAGFIYKIEDKVGESIKRALGEGLVTRQELFVVIKV